MHVSPFLVLAAAIAVALPSPATAQIGNARPIFDALNQIDPPVPFPGAPVGSIPKPADLVPVPIAITVPENVGAPIETPGLPTLPGLANLGGAFVSTGPAADLDVTAPGLPSAPDLGGLPARPPGLPSLPSGDLAGLPEIPGGDPGLPDLGLPLPPVALPSGVPGGLPSLPAAPGGLPGLPELALPAPGVSVPAGLPAVPAL